MGKNRELNEYERGQVVGLWKAGKTYDAIGRILKIPKSTVTDAIVRHDSSNNGSSAKRIGRPRSINEDDCQKLKQITKKKGNRLS